MARPKSLDKRNAILAAAIELIAEQGLSVSTSKIAQAAGVAEGTLFTYFETKERLLNDLYLALKYGEREEIMRDYPFQASLKERARHFWNTNVALGVNHPDKYKAASKIGRRKRSLSYGGVMGNVIIGTTMSLDGFMNDRNGDISRLYPDLEALRRTEMLQEEIRTTGAVVMGRRSYNMAAGDLTGYEYQVPIFVLTHHIPKGRVKGENERLTVTFVTEGIERAIERAKAAAVDKHVMVVGGANTAQQCLRAGLVDEIRIGIVPVLLGEGLRFFEPGVDEQMKMERTRVFASPTRTDLWFRLVR